MTRRIQAKHKIERRLKVNLWGRTKSPFLKREYGPGQHGASSGRRRMSDFGTQLAAKQKLKGYYANLNERQFRNLYKEASASKGDTSENLIGLLERRLDATVYRMKFVPSPFAARQLISHGHILVNGKRVTIPSYRLKEGDTIEVKAASRKIPMVMDTIVSQERQIPDYVKVDFDRMQGTFLRTPLLAETPYPVDMEPGLVIEYYSR